MAFCHLQENLVKNKYGKKLMDTTAKTGMDSAKTASKQVVQKTAEATGNFIRNKTADKITSLGKTKNKEKEEERQEIYIPPEKKRNYWWLQIVLSIIQKWHTKKLQTY